MNPKTENEPPVPIGNTIEERLLSAEAIIKDQHIELRGKAGRPAVANRPSPSANEPQSLIREYESIKKREDSGELPQGSAWKFFVKNKKGIHAEKLARDRAT